MQLISFTLGAILSSSVEIVIFSYQAFASPQPKLAISICYMTLADGRTVNLSYLCGKTFRKANDSADSLIDLKQNRTENLSNGLDYSSKTRALLTQVEALQQRLLKTVDEAEVLKIISQVGDLQKQMIFDPNYVGVDKVPQMTDKPYSLPGIRLRKAGKGS